VKGDLHLEDSDAWSDRMTHFTGFNKPFHKTHEDVHLVPKRFRDATLQWMDTLSQVMIGSLF
jgi:hypothetical protein